MSLEEKLTKLVQLATEIEGDISLEKSLEIFAQSVVLADECVKILDDCKGQLVVLQDKAKEITNEK